LAIATKMKLIDIEYQHQLVTVAKERGTQIDDDEEDECSSSRLLIDIDDSEVSKEKRNRDVNSGAFATPLGVWSDIEVGAREEGLAFEEWLEKLSVTRVLKRKKFECKHKMYVGYIQRSDDQLRYTPGETVLMRFCEVVRRFVLEV
jgi:hypothetical protein